MLLRRVLVSVVAKVAVVGLLLFVSAGTFRWWQAWVFLGVLAATTALMSINMLRHQVDLLAERSQTPFQKEQPSSDKLMVLLYLAGYYSLIIFVPLDVFRLRLLGTPDVPFTILGLGLCIVGTMMMTLAFRQNAFAASVVKHQEEKQQIVIDTGIYSVVRHPIYGGAALLLLGMPLWLGSWAGLVAAIAPVVVVALRTLFEEQFLVEKLDGYRAYTQRVRYRLLPLIW